MCGIAGWLGAPFEEEGVAERLAHALHHRGPDAHGIRSWVDATLVHTRLSIIDLSTFGAQPMRNEDGTVWTVFNGEIYNHSEIRRYLENRGHQFRGHSDTEVLPHLYEEEGTAFVNRLRGMFALAIYDTRTRSLLLARDHFGIKPLFYAANKEHLAFASEIRALLTIPEIDDRPDKQAIHDFAALFYIPAPETCFVGIRALQPGEILEARQEGRWISWRTRTYHQWSITPDYEISLRKATDRAEELVSTAVHRQLESDVPLGALLSGGIDSSLVSSAAQSAVGGGIRTFNVRFADREYDETWAAVAVANHIGSHHEVLDMDDAQGTWDHVTDLLSHAGQPFADTSLFAVNAVSRLMREHVTVALSGDGGDEAFGGYKFYRRLALMSQLQKLPFAFGWGAGLALAPLATWGIVQRHHPQRIRNLAGADDTSVVQYQFCPLHEEEHLQLCLDSDALPVRRLFEPQWEQGLPAGASRLERLSAHITEVNIRVELANDFLFKVDTASMRESLEVRVPLLDEDLFAFGLSLPHRLKVSRRAPKRVLRAVAKRKLPPEVVNKPKQGFSIPVDTWVDAQFKTCLREVLLGSQSTLPGFFNPIVYRPMIEAFCSGRPYPGVHRSGLYRRAIMLLSVHLALTRRQATRPASQLPIRLSKAG
jgi:asparagine synthase (glutamine-hydrolysing)